MPTPDDALDGAARDFLATPGRFATLSTLDADGSPFAAVIWYDVLDDGRLLINSMTGRRWPANLLRDQRCALTVEAGYRYVSVRGVAEPTNEGGEAAQQDIERLARRYVAEDEIPDWVARFRQQDRISFVIVPRSVTVHH
ncbi:MAG: TIGR03618 family F420-dependent PPOX class oxidoreductase [Chloroflexi bacterium]|nr:TIGR03618 family F420-dependent PPOX class oxidoreductase [Chloroflexota bacterium]